MMSRLAVGGRSRRFGFTLAELLVILVLLACLAGAAWHISRQVMLRKQCKRNLYAIYNALELYEIDRGTLPRLAFYPDQPRTDRDSPLVVLRAYCSDPSVFVCPAAPAHYRETGLTYVWNVNLNGRKMQGVDPPTWIFTELQALSDTVPPPHLGVFNVLYTDGHVRKMKTPPEGLREM
jgi:prepilin-type processing-associated H-X9-DG protein